MACWPAALLLLLSAAGAAADPVTDGFESESLGPLGNSRFVTPGRVSVQSELVHSGATALRVELREGDVAMVGVDGVDTERTEVQEADGGPGSRRAKRRLPEGLPGPVARRGPRRPQLVDHQRELVMANSINGMAERFRTRLGQKETIPLPGCYDLR